MVKIEFPKINFAENPDIKAVFLDIDDTLYDYEYCHNLALIECEKLLPIDNFKNLYKNFRNIVTKRLEPQGACRSRLLAFIELFEYLNFDNPYELAIKYDKKYWNILISHIALQDDAKLFIENCKEKSIKIVITTDMTTEIQIKKLRKLNILKDIKYLVTSEQAGAEKSSVAIFHYALQKINYHAKNVICIGDSIEKDYNIPLSLGIKSYIVKKLYI